MVEHNPSIETKREVSGRWRSVITARWLAPMSAMVIVGLVNLIFAYRKRSLYDAVSAVVIFWIVMPLFVYFSNRKR
jgi:hypothetical protein